MKEKSGKPQACLGASHMAHIEMWQKISLECQGASDVDRFQKFKTIYW